MNIRIVLLVTLTTVTSAFADCPPPMIGELKTAVRYIPAENWSKFEDYFDAHIEFLTKQMQAGSIQIAGPFLTKDKQLNGGLTIYNYTDFPIVEAMVSQDALVKVKVVTYEINSWMECSIAKP